MSEQDAQGFIKGEVVFTIFENKENHFSILKLKIHETNESFEEKEIVLKGHFTNLQQGVVYLFNGALTRHPRFGMQYDVSAYQTYVPATKDAVIAYLSSDIFEGVGQKTAEAIVKHFGENAIEQILKNPDSVQSVPNIKKQSAKNVVQTLQENQGFEQIAVSLTQYGIGLKKAQEIYFLYKQETMHYIQENPYQFMYDIEGISFQAVDKIAELNGISATSELRIRASAVHAVQLSTLDGHVYLPLEECIHKMVEVLNEPSIEASMLQEQIAHLSTDKKLILKDEHVYLPSLYYAEDHFSAHVKRIMEHSMDIQVTDAELMKIIGKIEDKETISYGADQFSAIKQALDSKVMILTGGPGTGKTTVVKGILAAYASIHDVSLRRHDYDKKKDFPFVLTAPTGRAAKRLQESTNMKAMTIHRLLGWDGQQSFEKNEYEQLSGKLLIIDEFSMVDTWLANHLFKAVPDDMQVLLVGDEDQLPSVGPGQVLSDLNSSGLIPYMTLNEVYRQKEGSKIIQLAHQIKNNTCSEQDLQKEQDFSFIPCQSNQVTEVVSTIIQRAKDKDLALNDMQILAPMYRTNAGIHEINRQIQEIANPPDKKKRERLYNDAIYRVGDRMIQLVNQPDDGVYNGDIGEIVQIFSSRETEEKQEQLVVAFDDVEVVYTRNQYLNIMHAYCVSIHKAQGSEFPIVILPVVHRYSRMLRKNLLYTAITRSKKSLILCGEKDAFFKGIETLDTDKRYTTLKQLLQQKISDQPIHKVKNKQETPENELPEPEAEETDISPYDFM